MTAGEPDPVQWICRRRAPISTSWPRGGGGGAALSCACAGRALARRMRTESMSLLLVTQWLLRGIPSKAATVSLALSRAQVELHRPAHGRTGDYRGWPVRRLHSPRTARMTEKIEVTASARSVQ